jgi:4-amino-4-deoxy-L-arabinose transferase-like glycosyltransferase
MTRRKIIGIVVLIILFSFLLRFAYFVHTLQDIDEGSHAAVAATLMNGGLPYLNAVNNKPPGIFYIYKITFLLFGRYNMTAVHMVTFFWTLATATVLSALAGKLGGKNAALCALLFYMTFTAALYPKMIAANSEIFMALPYTLGVLLLWQASVRGKGYLYFIAGFVSGLAPLFKQIGGVLVVALLLYLLVIIPIRHGRSRVIPGIAASISYGIGFAAPAAIVAFLFHRYGVLNDWIFWNLTYAKRYISTGNKTLSFPSQLLAEFVPFVLATLILWLLALLWIRSVLFDRPIRGKSPEYNFAIFIVAWLTVSTVATMPGSRMFGHYFIQILPPLSLMAALLAGEFFSEPRQPRAKAWRCAILALTIVPGLIFAGMAVAYESTTDTWSEIHPDFRPAAEYIRSHTRPEDRIFVWGWFTPIYVYSQRAPSTRFVFTTMHTGYRKGNDLNEDDRADIAWAAMPEAWPMLEQDLDRDPPELIIDTSPGNYHDFGRYPLRDYPVLRNYVDRCCQLEKSIAGMDIYRCGQNR